MASEGGSNQKAPGRGTAKHRACSNKKLYLVTQNIFISSLSVYMQCLHHRTDLGGEGIPWKGEIHLLGTISIGKQLATWLPHHEHGPGDIY